MKYDWTISDTDSSGNIEEKGKGEYKRLRASLQFSTATETQLIASMLERGWDDERVTDLYLTRRPSRVRVEGLHQGWLTAGGAVESLDQFLSRLIGQARELVADKKQPTLITDTDDLASSGIRMAGEVASEIITDLAAKAKVITEVDKQIIGRNSATEDGSEFNEELIYEPSLTQG